MVWLAHATRGAGPTAKLIRRWFWQMGLNAALVAAVFVAAAFVERSPPGWLKDLGLREEMLRAFLWLVAVLVALPLFIATVRKLQALGLFVAEAAVADDVAGPHTAALRAVIARVIPLVGTVILGGYGLALGSALLPSLKVLMVLLLVVGLITWVLWRSLIKVYSKAQVALHETLTRPPPERHPAVPAALPSFLREANLETVSIGPGSSGARKLIRELQLRTQTGASIVGIERYGASLINPGPDEELQPGDSVLLLGTADQLSRAREMLQKSD